MSGYTKGPWKWWTSNSFRRLSGPDGKDGGVLCPTVSRNDGHPDLIVSKADMALIESAPDLLEVLEYIRDSIAQYGSYKPVNLDGISDLIARAKGDL